MPILGTIASSIQKSFGSFESIATVTLSTTTSTINFTGIAGTYQHLQVRYIARDAGTGTADASLIMRLGNGSADTGANYAHHNLDGNSTNSSAYGTASTTNIVMYNPVAEGGTTANIFGAGIIDIHDYASTTKYKTTRSFQGLDLNGSGRVAVSSGLWMSTSAINYIRLYKSGTGFASGSTFALYGIKGA